MASDFFNRTMKSLLEAVAIENDLVDLEKVEGMPADTFRVLIKESEEDEQVEARQKSDIFEMA